MNKPPKVLQVALLGLALAGAAAWAWRSFGPTPEPATAAGEASRGVAAPVAPEPEHLVLVTYFTSDQRCPTCLKIEKASS